jgi:hypothetical protein
VKRLAFMQLPFTPRERLQVEAARLSLTPNAPPHPILGRIPFGKMSDDELRELIAWYKNGGKA